MDALSGARGPARPETQLILVGFVSKCARRRNACLYPWVPTPRDYAVGAKGSYEWGENSSRLWTFREI